MNRSSLDKAQKFLSVLIKVFLALCLATQLAWAQDEEGEEEAAAGPRQHASTIIYAGLGGAVLGLSTLSFYGSPQDHLQNVAVGFALGVLVGTGLITYKAVSAPEEFYGYREDKLDRLPSVVLANSREAQLLAKSQSDLTVPVFRYRWSF